MGKNDVGFCISTNRSSSRSCSGSRSSSGSGSGSSGILNYSNILNYMISFCFDLYLAINLTNIKIKKPKKYVKMSLNTIQSFSHKYFNKVSHISAGRRGKK